MASVDDIFKNSGVPSKRKLDPVRNPAEIYKSTKLNSRDLPSRHQPHVQDEDDAAPPPPSEDTNDNDDYGPAPPPDEDAGDDEEGRFFGGGITAQEKQILDFIDDPSTNVTTTLGGVAAVVDDDKMDASWLRKTALAFEKRISRNAELRARHASEPARFIDSEADLDAAIKALSLVSSHPDLYPDLARLGTAASLASLLAHDNTDIAIDAVEVIGELLADDDTDAPATDAQWRALADALLEADLLGLLTSHFGRLDEATDAEGVYHALGVLEALCARSSEIAETVGADDALVRWLLSRAARAEKPVSQNKQYAAEIVAILVQSSPANRRRLAGIDAVDTLLQLAAAYRRRDPDKGGDEEEYMQNVFEALTCTVDEPEGKTKFVEAEGVELCLLMLKEAKLAKPAALRLLDHAATGTGTAAAAVCTKIVEAGGLKTLFTLFMKQQNQKKNDPRMTEHIVGILAGMLRLLAADSPERIRTLAKFVEKDYEKTDRLVRLRHEYRARVRAADEQIAAEKRGMSEAERDEMAGAWFSQRLDAGLFCLQTIDVILAWLIAEDGGAAKKIKELLADRDETVADLRGTIEEQLDGIDTESDEGKDTQAMLSTLARFLT